MARFGACLGLAFQVVDDILDVTADSATLGKTAGKDAASDKPTFVSLMGLESAQAYADRVAGEAHDALRQSGLVHCDVLHALADWVGRRVIVTPGPRTAKPAPPMSSLCCPHPVARRPAAPDTRTQLHPLADELRSYLLDSVSRTGGHLSSNLGTVELTVALHYVFNTPEDRLVWDVGHQTYPHKILTGRRDRMHTCASWAASAASRAATKANTTPFGTAHSSTSISAALGMALAAKIKGENRNAVAIIGDGAMTAGMAFEALNNAGVEPTAVCWWCSTTTTCRSRRPWVRSTATWPSS
jgi:hypothetical protein